MNLTEANNLYKKEELLLGEDQQFLLVFLKDIVKVPVSKKLKKGHSSLIEKEYSYHIPKESVEKNPFYSSQLPHVRYVKWLHILNEQKQIVQTVPILKVFQTRRGGLTCCIDRKTFTQEMDKNKNDSIKKNRRSNSIN